MKIRLQEVGMVEGTPAANIEIGDTLMWNYGYTSKVRAKEYSKTGKTMIIVDEYDGKLYKRRLGINTLICILKKGKNNISKAKYLANI